MAGAALGRGRRGLAVPVPTAGSRGGVERSCIGDSAARFGCLASIRRVRWCKGPRACAGHGPHHAEYDASTPSLGSAPAGRASGTSTFNSAADCYDAGCQCLREERWHAGLSLLLRAQRLSGSIANAEMRAICEAATEAADRVYREIPSLVPLSANRQGSLLLLQPPGVSQRHKTVHAPKNDCVVEDPAAGGQWKYEPWLCGGDLLRIDCSTDEGFSQALSVIGRRLPVVMTNLGLLPATASWNIKYLQKHTTDYPGMTVLRSTREENRYLYYFAEQSDRDMSAFQGAPKYANDDLRMSFASFLQSAQDDPNHRYYLQLPVVLRQPNSEGKITETWNKGLDHVLRSDLDSQINRKRLEMIEVAGRFGYCSRSQLFVGPDGSHAQCHYDQYDNIFNQVAGEKHMLIFDPRAAEGLYPFPTFHPYDEYSMVDLSHVDDRAFPRAREALAGRGRAVTLRPGESLYIPTHWWHFVQGGASSCDWCISVNLWFSIERQIVEPPYPLPLHLELELARHAEFILADVCGSAAAEAIAAALRADVDGGDGGPSADTVSLPTRNFLLHRLAHILGPEHVCHFVREHFPPERFDRETVRLALRGPPRRRG